MKRTIILTIVVIIAIASVTEAKTREYCGGFIRVTTHRQPYYGNSYYRPYSYRPYSRTPYRSYGYGYSRYGYNNYGYYGSDRSLSDAIFGWTDERKLQIIEKEQDFHHEQERTKTEQAEREQMFARAKALKEKQAEQEQKNLENEKLRQEVERLELELKKAQLEKELKILRPTNPNNPDK